MTSRRALSNSSMSSSRLETAGKTMKAAATRYAARLAEEPHRAGLDGWRRACEDSSSAAADWVLWP
jgi:hypothetical protein